MRLTFNTQYGNSTEAINGAAERLAAFQRQVASGRRIDAPSQDPTGTATAIRERDDIAAVDRYTRAADSVNSRLSVMDSVLTSMLDKITAAQSEVTSARNSIATDDKREAAAQVLIGIRDSLVDDVNTAFRGTYLFAGAQSTTKPYTVGVNGVSAYGGSGTGVRVDISDGRSVAVAIDGSAVVDAGGGVDVFSALTDLAAAIRARDQDAVTAGMSQLGAVFSGVSTTQSRLGADLRSVEVEKGRLADKKLAGTTRLSTIEDANMAEALSGMSQADTAYRAALGAAATGGRVSLLDYLR